jgi:hypothetical protein
LVLFTSSINIVHPSQARLQLMDSVSRGQYQSKPFFSALISSSLHLDPHRHISTSLRCFCLFATHFHELTHLANQVEWVDNYHVVCDVSNSINGSGKEITLLYKVAKGISDQSFGIHVAEMSKFPEEVIKVSRKS